MPTSTKPLAAPRTPLESPILDIEVLFKEARQRERRRHLKWLRRGLALVVLAVAVVGVTLGAAGSTTPHSATVSPSLAGSTTARVVTCAGEPVTKPSTFVISCADANSALTKTHWTSWTSTGATGTTTFALNLCTPYCAASPISYFAHSTVHLSAPETTTHGRLFSTLVVDYTSGTTTKRFSFSWKGDRSF